MGQEEPWSLNTLASTLLQEDKEQMALMRPSPPCLLSGVWKHVPVSANGKEGKHTDSKNSNRGIGCHFELPSLKAKNIEKNS